MPAVKTPCIQCKGDEQKPKCRRCQAKHLPCSRPAKRTVFRHDSAALFAKDQKWVNSEARQFQFDSHTAPTPPRDGAPGAPRSPSGSLSFSQQTSEPDADGPDADGPDTSLSPIERPATRTKRRRGTSSQDSEHQSRPRCSPGPTELPQELPQEPQPPAQPDPTPLLWTRESHPLSDTYPGSHLAQPIQHHTQLPSLWQEGSDVSLPLPGPDALLSPPGAEQQPEPNRRFPLEDVQEACLMRYYVEELSHWFDLCDESRHFQTVVPVRARSQPHLLNAIFAVAARHLARLPQFKTPQGAVQYQGQLLRGLSKNTAVEYMLRCIPALRGFHDGRDDEYRDSIIATAVILRQLEEIDDEDDDEDDAAQLSDGFRLGSIQVTPSKQVNFLPVIDAVLSSPSSQMRFGHRSLIQAAYWMALRQEIYHSFTRSQPPQMILAADYWQGASNANKSVLHTVQVAKWRWGDGSEQEWQRLVNQQEHLERDVLAEFRPIYYREADKSKGEIFPVIWYSSIIEVTSIQLAKIAKSILLAENPSLRDQSMSRSAVRKIENQVRELMLELCGIALCHLASPPALLKAIFGIQLYGDFFTDRYERQAIRSVVERYRDAHAWPAHKVLSMFA